MRSFLSSLLAALLAPAVAAGAAPPPVLAAPLASPKAQQALILLPAVIADGATLRLPRPADGDLGAVAVGLNTLLTDTAQDLGLTVDLTQRRLPGPALLEDHALLERARALGRTLVLPSLRALAGGRGELELRLVLADPSASVVRVQSARVARDDIPVRAVILLRDLTGEAFRVAPRPAPAAPESVLPRPAKSQGRAALLISEGLFGGFFGYSIQRSSGAEDPRLLYPLVLVGTGIGLGGAIIAAEEWAVSSGEAFYIAAGEVWPTLAGHLIYAGRFAPRVPSDRWVFGLVGGTTGLALATLGVTLHGMSEGGALLAHSGGGIGLGLGALTEAFARGDLRRAPWAGMGYGAGIGWLAASAAAVHLRIAPSRVLVLDLGTLLGGLGAAALGSPLLLNEPGSARVRAWLGITSGGAVAGGAIALIATRGAKATVTRQDEKALGLAGLPTVGVIGESTAASGERAPIMGVSFRGVLR